MKNRIITISREFGSGGRTVGKQVAQKLNIPCYDQELIEKIAEESGFAPAYIKELGEYAVRAGWLSNALAGRFSNGLTTQDPLWLLQRKVILELAEKGPCVIVGRCADYILRNEADWLTAFIHADMDFKIDRVVRLYGESEKKPEARINDKNKKRAVNYKHFTNREWGKSQNYHIALNSKALGIEKCIEVILAIVTE